MCVLVLHLLCLLKPLAHHRNVASLSLVYSYYFGGCSSELAELVPLSHSCGNFISYSNRLHDFFVTFPPRCYKDFYVNSFFPRTARLWNSLPAECFPLTYDINGFKSRVKDTFFLGFFLYSFPLRFSYFSSFSCNPIPRSGCSVFARSETRLKKNWRFEEIWRNGMKVNRTWGQGSEGRWPKNGQI